ncbi:amidase domain-containing protein [Streptococcus suis]|uniref:amidase domain-containing protein n=1 Tax=Streptococcus suis TaxID=1307 RepID=UPI0028C3A907|nr:amidase domain-containing protein [Streptococcus suis]WNO79458.1 amidase domain-containing protein [Streptococcus suis]
MKKFVAGLMAISMLIVPMQSAFAEENNKLDSVSSIEKVESIKTEFEQMFGFDDSKTISLKGITNKMFIEFDSQEDALYKVKNRCSDILDKIKGQYNLDDLSEANWQDYYDGLYSIIDDAGDILDISETDYEYRFLRAFFDIYENKFKNDKVDELYSVDLSSRVIDNGEEKNASEVIANNLPYQSNFSKEYFEKLNVYEDYISDSDKIIEEKNNSELRVAINVEPAVSYASAHATSPNTPAYHYFHRGDCTNFVSQILEASGVSQDVYDSVHSGWWHKYNPNAWLDKHTHSRSWTMADTFARYMGVILTRTNHRNFSANVFRGSIIAGDWTDDGDWEHMAFVTAADNYVGSYGYYDYKVAQHTSDYHLWTSNSGNNWENIGSDGGRYGRIRD